MLNSEPRVNEVQNRGELQQNVQCDGDAFTFGANVAIWIRKLWDSFKQTFVILGAALLIFACARNTLTWYIQEFWGASGSFWQWLWEKVRLVFNEDPHNIAFWGTTVATQLSFWSCNAFFITLDLTGKPSALLKYKIQPDENMPVDPRKFKKALLWVLFNTIVIATPVTYVFSVLYLWRGCESGTELPTFQWVLVELTVFSLVEELMFYYSHRLFHYKALYRYIHKMHHEWTSPIGIRSVYAHPVEHVMSNLLPPLMGPLLMGSHVATAWLWFAVALFSTTIAHCGYHFPFLPSPEAHDFHHQK